MPTPDATKPTGVQSSGGVPTNRDFQGTISDGSTKVFATFVFKRMVPNNDMPWGNHGSAVAGVAVAKANDPSPVMGESHGLVGSAPNVRMMCIAARNAHIDHEVADQYSWMAGFYPLSQIEGFPRPVAARRRHHHMQPGLQSGRTAFRLGEGSARPSGGAARSRWRASGPPRARRPLGRPWRR